MQLSDSDADPSGFRGLLECLSTERVSGGLELREGGLLVGGEREGNATSTYAREMAGERSESRQIDGEG